MPITEILKHGRENAIRAEILAARCKHGLAAIAPVARKLGIPIGQINF